MLLVNVLIEIQNMIMTKVHQKRDKMTNFDCVIIPKVKEFWIDEMVQHLNELYMPHCLKSSHVSEFNHLSVQYLMLATTNYLIENFK